jgi:hypothetical protein
MLLVIPGAAPVLKGEVAPRPEQMVRRPTTAGHVRCLRFVVNSLPLGRKTYMLLSLFCSRLVCATPPNSIHSWLTAPSQRATIRGVLGPRVARDVEAQRLDEVLGGLQLVGPVVAVGVRGAPQRHRGVDVRGQPDVGAMDVVPGGHHEVELALLGLPFVVGGRSAGRGGRQRVNAGGAGGGEGGRGGGPPDSGDVQLSTFSLWLTRSRVPQLSPGSAPPTSVPRT